MATRYLIIIGLISFPLGMLAFWNGSNTTVDGSINGLIAVAAIIFGILGAWMSILNPVKALDEGEHKEDNRRRLDVALRLSPALKQATLALVAAILLRVSLLVLPAVSTRGRGLVELMVGLGWPNWRFPEGLANFLGALFHASLGASAVFLYLVEVGILMLTLLPILSVEHKHQEDEYEKQLRTDPASMYDKNRN